jgi:hypothetical protein
MKGENKERYIVLFMPWLVSLIFESDAKLSFIIAWMGSFFIFFLTLSGWVKRLPTDLSVAEQLMRPIYLVQIIFAGYMCTTSIFYFLDVLGYEDFRKISDFYLVDATKLELTAQCQRYYCLGHAAFVTGILVCMKYPIRHQYRVDIKKTANLLLVLAIVILPLSFILRNVQGLSQFSNQFNTLSFIAGTLALAFAIPQRKIGNTLICTFLYLSNFYEALLSGYKEPIITSILILGIFLYPSYKKTVLAIFGPALLLLFLFLPTYNRIFRENAWVSDVAAGEASQIALDAALDHAKGDADQSNWDFLAYRLSEIEMFTKFVKSTPERVDYYGFKLLGQSCYAIIPRIFWPSKPNTEDLVMERVYDAEVIHRGSNVSAKPAFVVDAYLSAGTIGIFISLFLYGAIAQFISQQAEKLFGGYVLGTAFIFSGLFQIMWRGLSFEFLINTIFWSYVSMLIIHKILVAMRVLEKN